MNRLAVAEHLFTQTYPALKDPKLLLSIVEHLLGAVEDKITERLVQAREEKRIPPFSDTFNGKLTAYKLHLARERDVHAVDFMLIAELQETLAEHHKSPVAFRRKESFVIADESYGLRTLSPEKTKTYIERVKSLLSRA